MFEGEDAFLINSSFQGLMSQGSGVRNCRCPCIAPSALLTLTARGVRVPRAASGEYSVLFGRESAPIAEGAGKLEKREIARAIQKFRGFYCQFLVNLLCMSS